MDKNVDAAPYSMEIMSIQNPEIIFVTSMGDIDIVKSNIQAIIDSSEPLQKIQAVENGRIYYLPQDLFLLSPGLDYPKAVKIMAELVYPDIFQ